jgi:hypothetical protein
MEWGDIEPMSETIEDVTDCRTFRLVTKPRKVQNMKVYRSLQMNLESRVHLPIHLRGKGLEGQQYFAKR